VVTHCGTTAAGGVIPPPRIRFTGCFLETNNIVDVDEDIIKGVEARRYRSYKMGDIIVKQDNGQVAQIDYLQKAQKYLGLLGQKLTQSQAQSFIELCTALQLNPFKREVYAVTYQDYKTGVQNVSIITGYEVYLKRAERTGKLNGVKVRFQPEGRDMKCIVEIYRKDWTMPFVHEVYMSEYNTHKALWATKPKTMLRKVAMSQAYRMAFPDELGGMPYTQDELDIDVQTKVINDGNGNEYEIVDDATAQPQTQQRPQPQPAQPQPQNPNEAAKQIQEAITHIWTIANQRELTEQDRQTIANGLQDRRNHTKGYFKQILDWLYHKPMKQGAA